MNTLRFPILKDGEAFPPDGVSSEGYEHLEKRQQTDPANLRLAHDVGLVHYWRARASNGEAARIHWQRVVANWSMVLEDDDYWRNWAVERQKAYGIPIEARHIAETRRALGEMLVKQLAYAELEPLFDLESKAIRLSKHAGGLLVSSHTTVRLHCGPLFIRQMGLQSLVERFFQRSQFDDDAATSLQIILTPLRSPGTLAEGNHLWRQLQFCFSELGPVVVYLERGDSRSALSFLQGLGCADCDARADSPASPHPLTPRECRDDCPAFAQSNPAYSWLKQGRRIYVRHRLELSASVYLSLAYRALLGDSPDVKAALDSLHEVAAFSQAIDLWESVKDAIVPYMLGWADLLAAEQQDGEAIALLEGVGKLTGGEEWKTKLALLLNARGVKSAEEEQWKEAAAFLYRAYNLHPSHSIIRQNLTRVLFGFAKALYQEDKKARACQLLEKAIRVGEAKPGDDKWKAELVGLKTTLGRWRGGSSGDDAFEYLQEIANKSQPDSPPEQQPPALVLDESQIAHLDLFDQQGRLQLDQFDNSGRTVMEAAQREAAASGGVALTSLTLLLALARFEGGETTRLLALQGLLPECLTAYGQAAALNGSGRGRTEKLLPLSQFRMHPNLIKILGLAWKLAGYDQGHIGDLHLLYGLLLHGGMTPVLEGAGVSINQMLEEIGWSAKGGAG